MERENANRQESGSGSDTPADSRSEASTRGSVLFVSQEFPPDRSGHASRIDETTTELAADGWDVTVLAPPACFPHGEFERSWRLSERSVRDGVRVIRLWAWQPSNPDPGFLSRFAYYVLFALHATLWTLFHRREFDALVTTTPPISTGIAGFVFGRRPWVVDVRDLWIDASVSLGFITEGGFLERASRAFQRRVLHAADSIAVTTNTVGDQLSKQYGETLGGKLVHVPNGVDVRTFGSRTDGGNVVSAPAQPGNRAVAGHTDTDPDESGRRDETDDRDSTDRESALSGEVIYTGNIGHAQNLDTCLRALQYLPQDVTIRLVGGGDTVPDLERLAETLDITDRVTFVEPVPQEEIPRLLDEADVGLAPLKDDPELAYAMPTKVYEYLGSELPVVVTGRGEIVRFVNESGGGVHAGNDPRAVAEAIESLLGDEEHRARVGRRGRAHVEEHYDRRAIGRKFSTHLAELVDGRE